MPLRTHTEPLDQGLRNDVDTTVLKEGELQEAEDCYYPLDDPAPRRIPGQTRAGTEPNNAESLEVDVHHLSFDRSSDDDSEPSRGVILTRTNLNLGMTRDDGDVLSFVTDPTTDPTSLNAAGSSYAVHHSNKFFILDGRSINQVAVDTNVIGTTTPSMRRHGLAPVTEAPTVSEETDASATWHTGLTTGYYWYWVTEKDSSADVESTFTGKSASVQLTATSGKKILVIRPEPREENRQADQWLIYRAGPTSGNTDSERPDLSTGQLLATVENLDEDSNSVDSYDDKVEAPETTALFGSVLGPSDWTNGTNLFADDDVLATASDSNVVVIHTFGVGSITAPVKGIEIEVEGKVALGAWSGSPFYTTRKVDIRLSHDGGATWGAWRSTSNLPFGSNMKKVTIGSKTDTWDRTWDTAELADGIFQVAIRANCPSDATISLDYLTVKIYHTGVERPTEETQQFPSVVVSAAGSQAVASGRNGEPPIATFGTVFEDSLVLNDVTDPSIIRYSFPGEPDYFPSPYFLNLETRDGDVITAMESRQDNLIVGLRGGLARVDTLPTETDVEFHRGRVWSIITQNHTIVGKRAATHLHIEGQIPVVAFVDRYQGLMATDGLRVWQLTEGIDWDGMVNTGQQLENCILINYPPWQALFLYYPAAGETLLTNKLVYHYDPEHLRRGGKLRVTGPCKIPPIAGACAVRRRDGHHVLLLGVDGSLWWEDHGVTDGAGVGIKMRLHGRDMYLAGIGNEFRAERVHVHYREYAGLAGLSMKVRTHETMEDPVDTLFKMTLLSGSGFYRKDINMTAEGHSFIFEAEDDSSDISVDHYTVSGKSYGPEEG